MIDSRTSAARFASLLCGLMVGAGLCSCSRVAAYERGRLAHPSMIARQRMSAGQAHLYAIREGARGGSLGAGSGCGCN
jgi:hypothetical protein